MLAAVLIIASVALAPIAFSLAADMLQQAKCKGRKLFKTSSFLRDIYLLLSQLLALAMLIFFIIKNL